MYCSTVVLLIVTFYLMTAGYCKVNDNNYVPWFKLQAYFLVNLENRVIDPQLNS